jgi:hypothetical protein
MLHQSANLPEYYQLKSKQQNQEAIIHRKENHCTRLDGDFLGSLA